MGNNKGDDLNSESEREELAKLRSIVENTALAIMVVDRNFNITFANNATRMLLEKNRDLLREVYPGFSAETLIGSCIDIFHKDPRHQRKLLSDPRNLPHSADAQIGSLIFNIRVTAQIDDENNYIGTVMEWQDVTQQRAREALEFDHKGQIEAISKSQAVIEFNMDGTIINANDNFLNTLGYSLAEIKGKHHRMFAEPDYAASVEYKLFWEKLNQGKYDLGEYKRIGKEGKEVWIQASYNPIMGLDGKPFKVVKYATDITAQKDALQQIAKLIEAVKHGDLGGRISTEHYDGFVKQLADDINSMMDAIVVPLRETSRVIQKLAEGDLRDSVSGEFEGEFADLRDAVNACLSNLSQMVEQILESSDATCISSSEISKGNEDLSQRTEEQAASLEQTASAMEEITSTVKQNADNAGEASQLGSNAQAEAEKGGSIVAEAITAMSEINGSSKKIVDIIGVIDEIAFQTNLLALNAAVEAARAGEQGRGFAVVASEVRNLAQRSAAAAKEIKELINDSVQKVKEGSRLVDESGETLDSIVAAVQKVSTIIADISSASREQAAGIEQINKAIAQMDHATQQNAALVEEVSAASESMNTESRSLTKLISFFKVGN